MLLPVPGAPSCVGGPRIGAASLPGRAASASLGLRGLLSGVSCSRRQPLCLGFVAGYQGLKDGPQTRGLDVVVFTPCSPPLFLQAGVVPANALLPKFAHFLGVLLASAAFYHGVEFAFDLFRPPYIHPSTPVRFSRAWTLTLVLPAYLCQRTPALGQRLDAPTGYCPCGASLRPRGRCALNCDLMLPTDL